MKIKRFLAAVIALVIFVSSPIAHARTSATDEQIGRIMRMIQMAAEANPTASSVVSGVTNANLAAFLVMAPPGSTIKDKAELQNSRLRT